MNNKLCGSLTSTELYIYPDKVFIKTFASGIDFLGWVNFPHHKVLRTSTKHRMFQKLEREIKRGTIKSYLGLLSHGNTYKLRQRVKGFEYKEIL